MSEIGKPCLFCRIKQVADRYFVCDQCQPPVQCAWCQQPLQAGNPALPVSHGACRPCAQRLLEEWA